jgi:acyl CoA:acetate/3-ketoacid CoA transferase
VLLRLQTHPIYTLFRQVVFLGTLTSRGEPKFVKDVREKTFAAAAANGRPVLYVTERCVFTLTPLGLVLSEVASSHAL